MQDPLLRDLLALAERSDVITFSVGLPAAELLPLATLRAVMDELVDEVGPQVLLHSPTEGITHFREAICHLMIARGIRCSPAEVLVTSGSQQGLDLAARVFVAPGDAVVVEEPSFFGALQVFRRAQARLLGVPVDADGMRTDVLESLLARQRPKLIYTLPTFQNPSGAVMSWSGAATSSSWPTATRCRCSRTTPTTSCATRATRSRPSRRSTSTGT